MYTTTDKRTLKMFGIFCCIGLLITPLITTGPLSASPDSTCSTSNHARETTAIVLLTEQQTKETRIIFDALKDRLSTVTSTEETKRIFGDTIIELERHHLLPEGMSIEQAQRLVNDAAGHQNRNSLLQQLTRNHQMNTANETVQNMFCYIAGNTSNTHVAKLAKRIALRLYYIIDFHTGNAPLVKVATALFVIFNDLAKINQLILRQDGYHGGVCIYFGNYHYAAYPNWSSPAEGWLSTDGLYGKQNITGQIWGQTMTGGWQPQVDWYMNYSWRGCLGFSGLILYSGTDTVYYLGSALAVNVGPQRP